MRNLEPISEPFDARVEPSVLDQRYIVVDPTFAAKLKTEHHHTFELETAETPTGREQLTPDVPNVGSDDLAHLDDRGLPILGTEVEPGTILIGRVTPRGGELLSSEEKLLRAIFGEKAGDMRDSSLCAPPGCFGVVTDVRADPVDDAGLMHAAVDVAWERPLDVGDVLLVNGEPAVVAAMRPLSADIAWSGGAAAATVTKAAMARDVLHARSIGPYSMISQQPVVGREHFGGQRLLPAQIELLASRAPWALWEMMTIKSDSVIGRTRAYEAIVKQENPDVVPRAAPAAPVPPKTDGARDIVSFFERPTEPTPGEVPAMQPEGVTILAAHVRALGFELTLRAREVGAVLLTAEQLREGSHGRVRKPETLGARTLKPEPDGLFCERIFGPTKDYECACGKYKRMKHRGIVCEKCGVEVIQSKVRRERFGYVELAVPCLHPLLVGEVATLLDLSESEVRQVVNGQRVLRGEGTAWHTEDGTAAEGGRALWDALEELDLEAIDAIEAGPRAELAAALVDAERPATALMLAVVPVLPPDLRPMVVVGEGFASSDLNDLYRRLINRSNRLARLLELEAPLPVVVNEQAQLQAALDELMVEGRPSQDPDKAPNEERHPKRFRALVDLVDDTFGHSVFEKVVDYSGVAHVVVDPSLSHAECRVPRSMLLELFKPHAYGILEAHGYTTTIKSAKRMITQQRPEGIAAIEEASMGYPVLLMAGAAVVTRRVRAWDAPAIAVDESTARHLASHTVTLHVPLMHEAAVQCAALDDLARADDVTGSSGWLCCAREAARRDGGGLVGAVVGAVLHGERDGLDDSVVALALGRPPARDDELDDEVRRWAEHERARRGQVWERVRPEPDDPEQGSARSPYFDRRLDELELSVPTSNALASTGLRTIGELCQRTEAELLETRNFGRRELREIKEILADLALSLGMRPA